MHKAESGGKIDGEAHMANVAQVCIQTHGNLLFLTAVDGEIFHVELCISLGCSDAPNEQQHQGSHALHHSCYVNALHLKM